MRMDHQAARFTEVASKPLRRVNEKLRLSQILELRQRGGALKRSVAGMDIQEVTRAYIQGSYGAMTRWSCHTILSARCNFPLSGEMIANFSVCRAAALGTSHVSLRILKSASSPKPHVHYRQGISFLANDRPNREDVK